MIRWIETHIDPANATIALLCLTVLLGGHPLAVKIGSLIVMCLALTKIRRA